MTIGNEDYGKPNYVGNYHKFYHTIKHFYPDIKTIITNISKLIPNQMFVCNALKMTPLENASPKMLLYNDYVG